MSSLRVKTTMQQKGKKSLKKADSQKTDSAQKEKKKPLKNESSDESSEDDSSTNTDSGSESTSETESISSGTGSLSEDFSDEDKLMDYYESKIKQYSNVKNANSTTDSSESSDVPDELVDLMNKAKLEYSASRGDSNINRIGHGSYPSTSVPTPTSAAKAKSLAPASSAKAPSNVLVGKASTAAKVKQFKDPKSTVKKPSDSNHQANQPSEGLRITKGNKIQGIPNDRTKANVGRVRR